MFGLRFGFRFARSCSCFGLGFRCRFGLDFGFRLRRLRTRVRVIRARGFVLACLQVTPSAVRARMTFARMTFVSMPAATSHWECVYV